MTIAGKAPSPTARIDVVNKTLSAMYVHKPLPTTYKDITQSAGYHPTTVSLALSTARDIGLTKLAGKKGLYNFLSPFGGTHVIPPRTYALKAKFNF